MNKDILKLAGVLNEFDAQYQNKYAETTGMYQAMTKIIKNKLEIALNQLSNPEWTREEDSKFMLEHLEKVAREALSEIDRIEKSIEKIQSEIR